jgi:hypothetical protein
MILQQRAESGQKLKSLKNYSLFYFLSFICFIFPYSGCASTSKSPSQNSKAELINVYLAKDVKKDQYDVIPVDETTIFTSEDLYAVMLVKIGGISGNHTLKWEWYDPKGNLYKSTDEYLINRDGMYRRHSSWHKIGIKEEMAGKLPGKWIAKVYLDNISLTTKEFEIKDISGDNSHLKKNLPDVKTLKTKSVIFYRRKK